MGVWGQSRLRGERGVCVWGGVISTALSMVEKPLHSGRGSSPQEQAEIPGRMEKEERFPGLHTVPI